MLEICQIVLLYMINVIPYDRKLETVLEKNESIANSSYWNSVTENYPLVS